MSERQVEVDAFDSFFTYPDAFEESLVVDAAEFSGCLFVGSEAVCDERECLVKVSFNFIEPQCARIEDSLCLAFLGGDSRLFFFEEVDGDGVGIVRLEQFLSFAPEGGQSAFLPIYFLGVEPASDFDVFHDVLADLVETARVEADDCVVVGNGVFHPIGREVLLCAAVASLSSEAECVLVGAPVSVGISNCES